MAVSEFVEPHGAVLATRETLDLMRLRYGEGFARTVEVARYGETGLKSRQIEVGNVGPVRGLVERVRNTHHCICPHGLQRGILYLDGAVSDRHCALAVPVG